jgi:hypothetical protein
MKTVSDWSQPACLKKEEKIHEIDPQVSLRAMFCEKPIEDVNGKDRSKDCKIRLIAVENLHTGITKIAGQLLLQQGIKSGKNAQACCDNL